MVAPDVLVGIHVVVDVDGGAQRVMAQVLEVGLEPRHIGAVFVHKLVEQHGYALRRLAGAEVEQIHTQIGVLEVMIRGLKIRHCGYIHAAKAGRHDVRVPPYGVGTDAAPIAHIVREEKLLRIAEEFQRVQIVIVKLVLRKRVPLELYDIAVHGNQRDRLRMRDARRRERKVILSRAELADIKLLVQRIEVSGGQRIFGNVELRQKLDGFADRGAFAGDGNHLGTHARDRADGIQRAVEVEIQSALEGFAILQHRHFRARAELNALVANGRRLAARGDGEHGDDRLFQKSLLRNVRLCGGPIVYRRAVRARAEHLRGVRCAALREYVVHGLKYGRCFRQSKPFVQLGIGDARHLRGQHITEVTGLGDHIIISAEFAENAHEMLALCGEHCHAFRRLCQKLALCGFDLRIARLAFAREAAFVRIFDEHIAYVVAECRAHMIKRGAFGRGHLVEHDQLVQSAYVFVFQFDLG